MRASNTPRVAGEPDLAPAGGVATPEALAPKWQALREAFDAASRYAVDEAPPDEQVRLMIAQLDALVGRSIAVMRELQTAVTEPIEDFDDLFGPEPTPLPTTDAASVAPSGGGPGAAPGREPPRGLVDVCFAAILELGQARRGLGTQVDASERIVAFETTRRRLCQTLIIVLDAGGQRALLAGVSTGENLPATLRLRTRYAAFRRALRAPRSGSADDVLTAVRYAAGAIAQLVSSPDFAIARAADRAVLRGLRERMLAWARDDKTALAGQRILSDIHACADLLRGINRRQELRGHDSGLLHGLRPGPRGDLSGWIGELRRLDGFDDELDALTAAVEADQGAEATVAAIVRRLEALQ